MCQGYNIKTEIYNVNGYSNRKDASNIHSDATDKLNFESNTLLDYYP